MAKTPRSVAVYARISSDQDGTQLGVQRQLEDCRQLAEELGWTIGEEYVDNDVSAYKGKRRPAFERMLADLEDRTRDAVVVYHSDRLTRGPKDLERFVEVVEAAGVRAVRFVVGAPFDPGNSDGLMVLRMMTAVAANESATKSRRVLRKMEQVAQSGMPHGGTRPFGYEEDRITIRESEAVIVRELADRVLAGESMRSVVAWLNSSGVPTVEGAQWRTTTVRRMLCSGRMAGLRERNGEIVGRAVWKPIITDAQRTGILAHYAAKRATNRRAPRRYLLSGMLRCGKCGNRLYSSAKSNGRRYVCLSGPDHGGCGRLTIVAPALEDLITDAVLYRLDTPELADALHGRTAADEHSAALADELAGHRARLDDLAGIYGDGEITTREWITARDRIEAHITQCQRQLARSSGNDALIGLVGNGAQLRTQWAGLSLSRQHAIISAVLDHAVIAAGKEAAPGPWTPSECGRSGASETRRAGPLPGCRPSRGPDSLAPRSTQTCRTTSGSVTFTGTPCASHEARTHATSSKSGLATRWPFIEPVSPSQAIHGRGLPVIDLRR